MCGIAGYSLSPGSTVDRTLAAQALLAAIAERGADAVGYAYRSVGDGYPTVVKQRTPASLLLERVAVPEGAGQLLVHVRDYTKGHPSIAANNHPVRHGRSWDPQQPSSTTTRSSPSTVVPGRPQMTVDSRRSSRSRPLATRARSRRCTARWRSPGSTSDSRSSCGWRGASAGRSGSARVATAPFRLDHARTRGTRALLRGVSTQRELREGTLVLLCEGKVVERAGSPQRFVEDDPLLVRAPRSASSDASRAGAIQNCWCQR